MVASTIHKHYKNLASHASAKKRQIPWVQFLLYDTPLLSIAVLKNENNTAAIMKGQEKSRPIESCRSHTLAFTIASPILEKARPRERYLSRSFASQEERKDY